MLGLLLAFVWFSSAGAAAIECQGEVVVGGLQVHGRRAAHVGPAWAEVVWRARTAGLGW